MPRTSTTISNNMRKIHSKDTSIELLLRKALWHKEGYRYRKIIKLSLVPPDIVLTKYKIAIFCDSEFFHRERIGRFSNFGLKRGKIQILDQKIERNRNRDYENDKKLLFLGYTVSFTSGGKIFPNIQMDVYKPLKKPFGIQNFLIQPLTMIYLKNNPLLYMRAVHNTCRQPLFLHKDYIFICYFFGSCFDIIHPHPFHLIPHLQFFRHSPPFSHLLHQHLNFSLLPLCHT